MTHPEEKYFPIKELLGETLDRIKLLQDAKPLPRGLESGFDDLDNLLSGFQPTNLILLTSFPSIGKTALVLSIAKNIALQGKNVGIISIDLGSDDGVKKGMAATVGGNILLGQVEKVFSNYSLVKTIFTPAQIKSFY